MATIVGFSGSLRKGSFNTALLSAAKELMPGGTALEVASIREFPLYDGDVEAAGVPAAVSALKERIAAADGLLIATPEYNHSIPGVAKNAVDWLSRPAKDVPRIFGGLPTAIMGASPGRFGTQLSQNAWLQVLHALGVAPYWGGSLLVAEAGKLFGDEGLADEPTRTRLAKFVSGFAQFVAANPRRR